MSEARPDQAPTAVVFDVGRVLYRWDLRHLFAKLIDDEAELETFLNTVMTEEWHDQHDRGVSLDEMVPPVQAQYPHYSDLLDAYRTRFNETIPGPVEGTHEIAHRLSQRGVPLFALTNFGVEFWEGFKPTAPIFDLFDDIVVSGREKCAKPDARIYQAAESRFGIPPQRLLFIDDKPENIAAARARGWHGHVFTDADSLEAELLDFGLLP